MVDFLLAPDAERAAPQVRGVEHSQQTQPYSIQHPAQYKTQPANPALNIQHTIYDRHQPCTQQTDTLHHTHTTHILETQNITTYNTHTTNRTRTRTGARRRRETHAHDTQEQGDDATRTDATHTDTHRHDKTRPYAPPPRTHFFWIAVPLLCASAGSCSLMVSMV